MNMQIVPPTRHSYLKVVVRMEDSIGGKGGRRFEGRVDVTTKYLAQGETRM